VRTDEDEVSAMQEGEQGTRSKGLGVSPNPYQERNSMRTILRALFRGKFTVLAVVAALTLATASTALAGVGVGAVFNLGQNNFVDALTLLVGNVRGPSLIIDNNSIDSNATALDLRVEPGRTPMKVNSGVKVGNLNADRLDNREASSFANGVNGKATDADMLGGKDSTQFLSAVPYENSNLVVVPAGANNQSIFVKCDSGDVAVSGGADNIEPPTELNEVSRVIGTSDTWEVEVSRPLTQGGEPLAEDPQGVLAEVYCWDKASPFSPPWR
jgi:hypothetical protein